MEYQFFDPQGELTIYYQRLPHWDQPGTMCFITWRTVDSIPQEVLNRWRAERAVWLRRHGVDPLAATWRDQLRALSSAARREYHVRFTSRWMEFLDECHGACVLRDPKLAKIVAEAVLHHDGSTCEVSDFVVMPNHVHLLAQFQGEGEMKAFCWSCKHFTAVRIHRALGESGHFWQPESFDHLVRSPEQFAYLQRYIAQNPAAARLPPGEYWHYQRAESPRESK